MYSREGTRGNNLRVREPYSPLTSPYTCIDMCVYTSACHARIHVQALENVCACVLASVGSADVVFCVELSGTIFITTARIEYIPPPPLPPLKCQRTLQNFAEPSGTQPSRHDYEPPCPPPRPDVCCCPYFLSRDVKLCRRNVRNGISRRSPSRQFHTVHAL